MVYLIFVSLDTDNYLNEYYQAFTELNLPFNLCPQESAKSPNDVDNTVPNYILQGGHYLFCKL